MRRYSRENLNLSSRASGSEPRVFFFFFFQKTHISKFLERVGTRKCDSRRVFLVVLLVVASLDVISSSSLLSCAVFVNDDARDADRDLSSNAPYLRDDFYFSKIQIRRVGPENFLARNGAGSEPVPAHPLGALPADRALYLEFEHQPLCNKLKRLGITCVFVAAKVVEVCAPPAGEFARAAEVSTFSRSQLLLAERALLRELEYDLYHPTCSSFASAFLAAASEDIKTRAKPRRFASRWFNDAGALGCAAKPAAAETGFESDAECLERFRQTSDLVAYVLEASTVARDGIARAPSLMAASAVGWVLSREFCCEWEAAPSLRHVSGFTERDVASVYGFLDRVVIDFHDADERSRGGFFANEKHAGAVEALWRDRIFAPSR